VLADAQAGQVAHRDDRYRRHVVETVQELLQSVSEQDRILLLQKEVEGKSLKELEAIYNVTENALKVRLFRARQRVLKAFEKSKASAEQDTQTAPGKV
jgi:RNA polymerase sigma-70 factor (ECF subfamily)